MLELENTLPNLLGELKECFGQRLLYVGLQGSYLRGEADANSDIDIMVLLDGFTVADLDVYRAALVAVGFFEKSCGFICGKDEMTRWNPLESCQLLHTTRDLYGRLADFVPAYTLEDEKNYIKISLGNLFHELCHRYIHAGRAKNIAQLPGSYKFVFFILQNLVFVESGVFAADHQALAALLSGEDKAVLAMERQLRAGAEYDFDEAFGLLFRWCQNAMGRV